jgi:peptidoglycan/xylan/chitin deacetylase (PgdA/CDA1 family)
MQPRSKTFVDAALRRTPLQPYFQWRSARSLAVLAYHDVRDQERFGAHLDYLRTKTAPVALDEVVRAAEGTSRLPNRAVLITFDDGHRDVLDVAMPMLRERGLPAVAFVVAGLLDTETPHWWTEVKDLVRAGGHSSQTANQGPDEAVRILKRVPDTARRGAIEELRSTAGRSAGAVEQLARTDLRTLESNGIAIGNHSLSHPCLSRCEDEAIRTEVGDAREILERAIGHDVDAFAYPDGDRDPRVSGVVRSTGHRVAFLFDHRLSELPARDPMNISRLRVDTDATFDRFRLITSGFHPSIHRVRTQRAGTAAGVSA